MSQIASTQRARFIPVFIGVFVLVATVALKLDVAGSKAALTKAEVVSTTMHAAVHQNNDIFLTFDDGSTVGNQDRNTPTIPAGTYTIRVVDDTAEHNFHLVGPGVDMSTDTTSTSSPTWTVTFQNGGTYRFVCDNHPDFMFGLFQASGSAGGSSGGPAPAVRAPAVRVQAAPAPGAPALAGRARAARRPAPAGPPVAPPFSAPSPARSAPRASSRCSTRARPSPGSSRAATRSRSPTRRPRAASSCSRARRGRSHAGQRRLVGQARAP